MKTMAHVTTCPSLGAAYENNGRCTTCPDLGAAYEDNAFTLGEQYKESPLNLLTNIKMFGGGTSDNLVSTSIFYALDQYI